ncbi:MAG: MFS transporter, partial [Alicyclobacillus sp.]|nr:MFS transporter [Alicyclobacillus sp.]
GLYISGNTVGGMSGRILTGMLTDLGGLRVALGLLGGIGVVVAVLFVWLLPASQAERRQPELASGLSVTQRVHAALQVFLRHLKDPGLFGLFFTAFCLMGGFVALYNYMGYLLTAPPYQLSQTAVGWIFLLYLTGTFSSAWIGRLADRRGRRTALWIGVGWMLAGAALTLFPQLLCKLMGLGVFTFGFFAGHATASSWVGQRATDHKAEASSLYLLFYYLGSSVGGSLGGLFWSLWGWAGVVGMIVLFILAAMGMLAGLSRLKVIGGSAN